MATTLRRPIVAGLALLAAATATVVWAGLLLPPPLWILKYGPTPGCEPTGRTWTIEGVEFVEIGRGISRMGSNWLAVNRKDGCSAGDALGRLARPAGIEWGEAVVPSSEMPIRWTELDHSFAIATTEVTNQQFGRFRSGDLRASAAGGERHPAAYLSWPDAKSFCDWLARESKLPVRLPTEAEWETAAKAGEFHAHACGNGETRLGEHAWFDANSGNRAHEVGTRLPNAWGIYDLLGNEWEWCADPWEQSPTTFSGSAHVEGGESSDPDQERVLRGGGYTCPAESCRPVTRKGWLPYVRDADVSFRPAFTPPDR